MQLGTNKKLQLIACHEAGHAVAAYIVDTPFDEIVLPDDEDSMDDVLATTADAPARSCPSWEDLGDVQGEIIRRLAGPAAQEILEDLRGWRHSRYGTGADRYYALSLAGSVCPTEEETQALMKYLWVRTKSFLSEPHYWLAVLNITVELLENRHVTWARTVEIITGSSAGDDLPIKSLRKSMPATEDPTCLATG
jgi:hypothetical protein